MNICIDMDQAWTRCIDETVDVAFFQFADFEWNTSKHFWFDANAVVYWSASEHRSENWGFSLQNRKEYWPDIWSVLFDYIHSGRWSIFCRPRASTLEWRWLPICFFYRYCGSIYCVQRMSLSVITFQYFVWLLYLEGNGIFPRWSRRTRCTLLC